MQRLRRGIQARAGSDKCIPARVLFSKDNGDIHLINDGGGHDSAITGNVERRYELACVPTSRNTNTNSAYKETPMRIHTALIAAAALAISVGMASAQNSPGASQNSGQRSGSGMSGGTTGSSGGATGTTGAPSSTNPQAGGGAGGLTTAPHQVPENGGAPNAVVPAPSGNPR